MPEVAKLLFPIEPFVQTQSYILANLISLTGVLVVRLLGNLNPLRVVRFRKPDVGKGRKFGPVVAHIVSLLGKIRCDHRGTRSVMCCAVSHLLYQRLTRVSIAADFR